MSTVLVSSDDFDRYQEQAEEIERLTTEHGALKDALEEIANMDYESHPMVAIAKKVLDSVQVGLDSDAGRQK